MKLKLTIMLIALFCGANALFSQGPANTDGRQPYLVSLIRVIANPDDFDGHRIRVIGYLGNNGLDRSVGLYVSDADGRNFVMPNSVDLAIGETQVKDLMGKYVVLSGTYHSAASRSGYNGHIDNILELKPLSPVK